MNKGFVRVALLSCAAIAVSPALANHSWGNYHWARTSNPFTLRVVDGVTGQWDSYLDGAISDWTASSVLNLTKEAGAGVNAKKCTAIAGKVLACNAAYGQRGWLGIASIWANGDHITQATTKLNDTYFSLAQYNTPAWRRLVTCQEIAHDFGLDHQDENFNNANLGSCMDYTNDPDGPPSNEHPNQHDYDQLQTIYGHLDGTTTIASAVAATDFGVRTPGSRAPAAPIADNEAGDSPAEWGRAVHVDGRGRPDVFVKDLGAGHKKITHVFWALEAGPRGRAE
jgi:hypothetical protein